MVFKLKRPKILAGGDFYVGDNYDSLRGLPPEYADMIYLDPPYNTAMKWGSVEESETWSDIWVWSDQTGEPDPFANVIYRQEWVNQLISSCGSNALCAKLMQVVEDVEDEQDDFAPHASKPSAYIAFMIIRLLEVHRVLANNGAMFLHVNDIESYNLMRVCNIIFGRRNLRSKIVWQSSGTKQRAVMFSRMHDEILYYTKHRSDSVWNDVVHDYSAKQLKGFRNEDDHGAYDLVQMVNVKRVTERTYILRWKGYDPGDQGRQWGIPARKRLLRYPWLAIPDEYEQWRRSSDNKGACLDWLESHSLITWRNGVPLFHRYEVGALGVQIGSVLPSEVFAPRIPLRFTKGAEVTDYRTMKPPSLLRMLMEAVTDPGDMVIDPFGGSGVTAAVAHSLRRRWVVMDLNRGGVERLAPHIAELLPEYWDDTREKYSRNKIDEYGALSGKGVRRELVLDIKEPRTAYNASGAEVLTAYETRIL